MKQKVLNIWTASQSFLTAEGIKMALVAFSLLTFLTVSAHAQNENEGVSAIVSAIDGLKPDMSTIVIAAIGLALVGIGAGMALSLGKKLMGGR